MCEPWITAKTGRTVAEHQRRTVDNLVRLRGLAPDLPIIPVVQGPRTTTGVAPASRSLACAGTPTC
jgi:hypothetical protein